MTSHIQNSEENPSLAKRRRVLAAVAQEMVTSEDDDNVADGMDICNIIENQSDQSRQRATSCALHALGETIRNTLLEINEIREQNRERRHRELLQILTKMVLQENAVKNEVTKSRLINYNTEIANNNQHNSSHEYVVEQDPLVNEDVLNIDEVANFRNNLNFADFKNVLNKQNHADSASAIENSSSKCIKLLPQITNRQQASKIESIIAIKHDDTKKELQKMRAQMLEVQRQKMEDRERKKREFLQM